MFAGETQQGWESSGAVFVSIEGEIIDFFLPQQYFLS